jgi:ribosomal protein S18 acetylase RimI-like enzyme
VSKVVPESSNLTYAQSEPATLLESLSSALWVLPFRLRKQVDADLPRLKDLYIASREIEIPPLSMPQGEDSSWSALMGMQFDLKHRDYYIRYPDALLLTIEYLDTVAGSLYLECNATRLHVIDILVGIPYRNRGMGGMILQTLQNEAKRRLLNISLQVDSFSPAMRLYHRMGFSAVGQVGPSTLMHWPPEEKGNTR